MKIGKWNPNATTVAGGNEFGSELNQLFYPEGIFLDKNQNIFIADTFNHRIMRWKPNEKTGEIVAGGDGTGAGLDQLNAPRYVIVDEQDHSLIIADDGNDRVIRWFNRNQQELLIDSISCSGLAMDKDGFLYTCDSWKSEVRRWKIGEKGEGKLVAGGYGKGNHSNQFNSCHYIFVDEEQSVYVSDSGNDRVMKWRKDATEGIVVAGGNGRGNNLNQLHYAQGIVIDELGRIYITDFSNHRIMRWIEGEQKGEIIVGGNGKGEESNQLIYPNHLSFDIEGNLYVLDRDNQRVQRFDWIS
ncbi:unnamed protein product [Adineta ricciae]|uniref:6-bladed beta-propeller n=1 Tax=Adineta ricciae TaxID=249248 RepID=A0A816FFB9_ADIRI|nr:unnamed protein product [Adineta ricciae]